MKGVTLIPFTPAFFDKPAEVKLVDLTIQSALAILSFRKHKKAVFNT